MPFSYNFQQHSDMPLRYNLYSLPISKGRSLHLCYYGEFYVRLTFMQLLLLAATNQSLLCKRFINANRQSIQYIWHRLVTVRSIQKNICLWNGTPKSSLPCSYSKRFLHLYVYAVGTWTETMSIVKVVAFRFCAGDLFTARTRELCTKYLKTNSLMTQSCSNITQIYLNRSFMIPLLFDKNPTFFKNNSLPKTSRLLFVYNSSCKIYWVSRSAVSVGGCIESACLRLDYPLDTGEHASNVICTINIGCIWLSNR